MIVYVVTETWWDSHEVHGVFSTEENAKAFMEHAIPVFGNTRGRAFTMRRFEVDKDVAWLK